jgi:hypothetical protein
MDREKLEQLHNRDSCAAVLLFCSTVGKTPRPLVLLCRQGVAENSWARSECGQAKE